jgi:Ca2+-binding EF-hand superfamily protein
VPQSTWKNNNTLQSQADITEFADESNEEKLLSKIRRLLRPTIKSINAVLDALDVNKTGFITNLEFRNAIRTLNLGLTQTEVDLLLNVCEIDGRVDIR